MSITPRALDAALLCRQHPWFTCHLPRYLAVMQADTVATASSIDQDLVDEVARLGFERQLIIDSITARLQVPPHPLRLHPRPHHVARKGPCTGPRCAR